jgi:hypothetical protein
MHRRLFAAIVAIAVCPLIPYRHTAAAPPADAKPAVTTFLKTYCVDCHGPDKQKGDRRFDKLTLPAADADTVTLLQDILDQLNLDDMPPKKSKQPTADLRKAAVDELTRVIADGRSRIISTGGQAVLRRLNRREYLNTVGDLFSLNMTMFDPTVRFPRDETVAHLDNVGDVLKTSGYLLGQYLDAADQVVEKAFATKDRPREQSWKFNGHFVQQPELRSHAEVFDFRYLCVYESPASERHEGAYAPLLDFEQGVPASGYYEIKVKAEAKNRKNPYDPKLFGTDPEDPFRLAIVAGNRQAGPLYLPQPIEPQLAETLVRDGEPEWYTFKVWLDAGFTPRFTFPNGMRSVREVYGKIFRQYNSLLPADVRNTRARGGIVTYRIMVQKYGHLPHIRIHEVNIRGPFAAQWPPASQTAVLGEKPFEPGRTRELLEAFADRAYRRPATKEEVDRLMAVVDRRRQDGKPPLEALKDGVKAALCSPAFLYVAEPESTPAADRKLPAYALASRLSYFLWSTMPDAELARLARTGDLLKPDVLTGQVRRMLASPKSDAFVVGFLDSWLNLRTLGDMPPDRATFERYYTQNLQPAMREETKLFTRHLIDTNASIVEFLDSDYTFVNRPLAVHYGMPNAVTPAEGHLFHKVKLADPNRGGLLGQGSVLTVTANGVETSPVNRGVWLLENILGTPPAPPPDNVPPIDPDIRGAKSIRDILTKHRDNPTCFDCHRKIDPLGFALETFDPIGARRSRYEKGQPIDTAGELPDGQSFQDVAGLKRVLVGRKDQFARALSEKLLSYACGRRIEPSDRPEVTRIVADLKQADYGFRHLIEQVVLSDTFRSK